MASLYETRTTDSARRASGPSKLARSEKFHGQRSTRRRLKVCGKQVPQNEGVEDGNKQLHRCSTSRRVGTTRSGEGHEQEVSFSRIGDWEDGDATSVADVEKELSFAASLPGTSGEPR